MRKKIWILNQNATRNVVSQRGHHYWIVRELVKLGYEPIIFCSNFEHFARKYVHEENNFMTWQDLPCGAKAVFVGASAYQKSSGIARIRNMFTFGHNLKKAVRQAAKTLGKPDVLYGSSPTPISIQIAEKLAKEFKCFSIAEVRDLWPESIFAYYPEKKKPFLAEYLYAKERKMYERASAVFMTWAGGKDYVIEKGWTNSIDVAKIHHVPIGVDIDEFDDLVKNNVFHDPDLDDKSHFNVVYTGSVRHVNNMGLVVEAMKILRDRGNSRVKTLVWGDGDQIEIFNKKIEEYGLDNIVFKGVTGRKNIPSLVAQGDCALLHNSSTILDKYGQSQNKFYEYLAAAKPVVMTYTVGHSICKKHGCGVELDRQTPLEIANALEEFSNMPKEKFDEMARNARRVAETYDTKLQTKKIVEIVENL